MLGDVAEISIGRTPSRSEPSYWTQSLERPFCSIADIGDGRLIEPSREGVTERAVAEGKAKRVPAGALLMSFKLSIGRTGIAARELYPNEAICWIKPLGDEVSQEFLRLSLPTIDFDQHIGVAIKGKTLNLSSLRSLPIVLPSIEEQRRIASLLSAVDRQIELSVSESARAFGLLEALRRQVIDLSDREPRPLSDFLKAIDGGRSLRSLERPPVPGERAVLKVSAVKPGLFVASEAKALADSASMPPRAVVRDGDVLMTRANTAELVGAVCRVTPACNNLYLSDKTLRLVFDEEKAIPAYFVHALAAPSVRGQLALVATGTSGSMKNVSQEKIRSLRVRAPFDVAEQRQLAEGFDAVLALARLAEQRSAGLRELRSSLIRILLSGQHEIPKSYDRFLAEDSVVAA